MAKKKTGRRNNRVQRRENAVDLISQLPKDVIETILERVPIYDAVRTSVLSKNWRYHWTSIRKLTFDHSFVYHIEYMKWGTPYWVLHNRHAEIVHSILLQHRGSLDSFSLSAQLNDWGQKRLETRQVYDKILHLASNKGVRNCYLENGFYDRDLCFYEDDVKFFPTLVSCSFITQLVVENFVVSIPPTFGGFPNLVRLKFYSVLFCGESLQFMTSTCPRLQYLTLDSCRGSSTWTSTLNVSSSNLKHLKVKFHFSGDDLCYIIPLTKLECLESLVIYGLEPSYMEMLVCLLRNAPNLLELSLELTSYLSEWDESVMFWEDNNSRVMLKHLKLLKIKDFDFQEGELLLLKVLLAGTPALEKIDFVRLRKEGSLGKLLQYPLASPTAKLVINGVVNDW